MYANNWEVFQPLVACRLCCLLNKTAAPLLAARGFHQISMPSLPFCHCCQNLKIKLRRFCYDVSLAVTLLMPSSVGCDVSCSSFLSASRRLASSSDSADCRLLIVSKIKTQHRQHCRGEKSFKLTSWIWNLRNFIFLKWATEIAK